MALSTAEQAKEMHEFIKKANGYSTWDRLAEFLSKQSDGREQFVINRSFDTSVEQMFDLWTKPEHIAQWLPPTGFTMEFIRPDDGSPGSSSVYFMTNGNGVEFYGRKRILEIHRPDSLSYIQQFCDKDESISRHPLAPTWPETMLTRVTFAAEDTNRTRVTVAWEPYGEATAEEIAMFVQSRAGMTLGWTGSFDKLEALL